jgi:hypothetical protein
MPNSDLLPSLLFKLNENQLVLEAAIKELSNWVEQAVRLWSPITCAASGVTAIDMWIQPVARQGPLSADSVENCRPGLTTYTVSGENAISAHCYVKSEP